MAPFAGHQICARPRFSFERKPRAATGAENRGENNAMSRAGAVDGQDGFEGFELLKPLDADRHVWLVMTRWRDEESFQAWLNSPAFGHGHRSAAERSGGAAPQPVAVHSELWSYQVADLATGAV